MKRLYAIILPLLLLSSCVRDSEHQKQVRTDLECRREILKSDALFDVLKEKMPRRERECMEFLYAYMPLCDLADYEGDFFRENVKTSLKARNEMDWGHSLPDDVFMHFVLPVRVNNENLDEARMVFYNELKDRVKDMSMEGAALEVNHWCHEKVEYRPTDSRTSSPLATVKTAFGRCGEESTLLVSALRSVCIPARQVYTPRWAHCDDNHAWVEVYVDGNWHFMGACEPEPILDLGWFNVPASRVLMVHTKAFGRYNGPEEKLAVTPNFTEINVTSNYADVTKVNVRVTDMNGAPAANAKVSFLIYNYAEFYPFATLLTDSVGSVSLSAGRGDMLVWATDGNRFGFAKLNRTAENEIVCNLTLSKTEQDLINEKYRIVPPDGNDAMPEVSDEMRAANDVRMAREDSIRNAYVASFTPDLQSVCVPEIDGDCAEVEKLVKAARGNWKTICDFLSMPENRLATQRVFPLQMLNSITDKDLRDVSLDVLVDHTDNSYMGGWFEYFDYTWNPRVSNEMLRPYKAFFQIEFKDLEYQFCDDPELIVQWCSDSILVADSQNFVHVPITPVGVYKARVADGHSRDIFFVALARSMGIPARINPSTGKVQYVGDFDEWEDVSFEEGRAQSDGKGVVLASYKPVVNVDDPLYYKHFTISRYTDGCFKMMPFDVGEPGFEQGDTWSHLLKDGLVLDEGCYLITTGIRDADGSVASTMKSFRVNAGDTTYIEIELLADRKPLPVLGEIDVDVPFIDVGSNSIDTIANKLGGRPSVVALMVSGTEPANHTLRDMAALKERYEEWGGVILFLFPDEDKLVEYYSSLDALPALPNNISCGIVGGEAMTGFADSLSLNGLMPVFMFTHNGGKVAFVSQGYTVGIGEQLLKLIEESE